MSRENVELVLRAFDAFNRRDLDGFLALMAEDVEAESRLAAIEGDFRGHEGSRRWWETGFRTLPDWSLEVLEVRDLGDFVLAKLRNRGHGAESRAPVEEKVWLASESRDGRCIWWAAYASEAYALEAIGLRR